MCVWWFSHYITPIIAVCVLETTGSCVSVEIVYRDSCHRKSGSEIVLQYPKCVLWEAVCLKDKLIAPTIHPLRNPHDLFLWQGFLSVKLYWRSIKQMISALGVTITPDGGAAAVLTCPWMQLSVASLDESVLSASCLLVSGASLISGNFQALWRKG